MIRRLALALLAAAPLGWAAPAAAQEAGEGAPAPKETPEAPRRPGAPAAEAMTPPRMGRIVLALDPAARFTGNGWELTLADVPVLVVLDARADRMRAMVPVRGADGMSEAEMLRVLQANFDTALDARYAVANGRLWSVFIHPLRSLERDQLISGIGQAVNAATSYGTLYSGGAGRFGSGDSAELQRRLLEDLLDRGQDL